MPPNTKDYRTYVADHYTSDQWVKGKMTTMPANPRETLGCIGFVPRKAYKSLDALPYYFQTLTIEAPAPPCRPLEPLRIRDCLRINQSAHTSALQYLQYVVSCIS